MDRILRGVMRYRGSTREQMVKEFKHVKDNPHVSMKIQVSCNQSLESLFVDGSDFYTFFRKKHRFWVFVDLFRYWYSFVIIVEVFVIEKKLL